MAVSAGISAGATGPAGSVPLWQRPDIIRFAARFWIVIAAAAWAVKLWTQTEDGLTDGLGHPFGDDFINYYSGAVVAWWQSGPAVYDWLGFHAFENTVVGASLDFYHYSYPPILFLLTAPLAVIPYLPAFALWSVSGWLAFWRALRPAVPGSRGLMLALAAPAVFVNAMGGQNGTWTAALLGGGLSILDRRPALAGVCFGLLAYKPHLGLLIPVALAAGRRWRAFLSAAATVVVLVAASLLLWGVDTWQHYLANLDDLRRVVLEDTGGLWRRMVSVFIFARRLGGDVDASYAVQAVASVAAAAAVGLAWWRDAPAAVRNALLVLGGFLATPYLQDYDLVAAAFLVAWLVVPESAPDGLKRLSAAGVALILVVPILAAPIGLATGFAPGVLFILPAFAAAVWLAFGRLGEPHGAA